MGDSAGGGMKEIEFLNKIAEERDKSPFRAKILLHYLLRTHFHP